MIKQVQGSDWGTTSFTLHIEVFIGTCANDLTNDYTIMCDGEWIYDHTNPIDIEGSPSVNQFVFGETGEPGENTYGYGLWNYFDVYGCSGNRFFDNFADGSINDWSDFSVDEEAVIRVLSSPPMLIPRQTMLSFQTNELGNHLGWVQTSYIDYDPDFYYKIEVDFLWYDGLVTDFVLVENGQVRLLIDDGNLVYDDGTNKVIATNLMGYHWYYLRIDVFPNFNAYWLMLDNELLLGGAGAPFYSNAPQDWLPFIRLGDFDRTTSRADAIEIDNLLLHQYESFVDYDGDGLSDDFETGMFTTTSLSKILVWSEDFESPLDPEEYGWDDHLWHGPNADRIEQTQTEWLPYPTGQDPYHVWEFGEPTDAYFGFGPREDPIKGYMDGIDGIISWEHDHSTGSVLATNLDDDYINDLDSHVQTPEIDLTNVNDARLVFWHWYDTEPGVDGGQVRISTTGNPPYSPIGTYPDFYNMGYVGSFGSDTVTAAFSENSGGWVRAEVSLSAYDGEVITLQFLFRSDSANCDYPGWYIDNIRIYGSTDYDEGNTDSDDVGGPRPGHALNDGQEYYIIGTSPFIVDTDGDHLRDNLEVCFFALNDLIGMIDSVPEDPNRPEYLEWINGVADPQVRDIFIECDAMNGMQPKANTVEMVLLEDVIEVFAEHSITMHLLFSDVDINLDVGISTARIVEIYDDKMTESREKLYYWCLFAVSHEGEYMGVAVDELDCRFALFMGTLRGGGGGVTPRIDDVFMHELGHCLGLDDFNGNENWQEPPGTPPQIAMIRGMEGLPDYMEENSDIWWVGTNPPVGYPAQRYLGGWEYACRNPNKTEWESGFCYAGLDRG